LETITACWLFVGFFSLGGDEGLGCVGGYILTVPVQDPSCPCSHVPLAWALGWAGIGTGTWYWCKSPLQIASANQAAAALMSAQRRRIQAFSEPTLFSTVITTCTESLKFYVGLFGGYHHVHDHGHNDHDDYN
jgi:hypothetical protein